MDFEIPSLDLVTVECSPCLVPALHNRALQLYKSSAVYSLGCKCDFSFLVGESETVCATLIQVAGSVSCQNRFGRLALLQLLNAKHVPILHKTCDKGTDHRTVSGKLARFSNAKSFQHANYHQTKRKTAGAKPGNACGCQSENSTCSCCSRPAAAESVYSGMKAMDQESPPV